MLILINAKDLINTIVNLKKLILIFLLFMSSFSYCQENKAQLPYDISPTYPKKATGRILMAKMLDELGYKYYWATDSLLNDEMRNTFNSRNLPRLLLEEVYRMSENIINYSSENNNPGLKLEEMSFEDFRKNTLLNLKEASNILIKNTDATHFSNLNLFVKSIAISNSYCDQIISFRENIGKPFKAKNNFIVQQEYESKKFERTVGADGLTNTQWKIIMERGGGRYATENIRRTKNINQNTLVQLRKKELATVIVGNLESIGLSSNIVDGLTYTYFNDPPKQLSFLFSNDKELIEGFINWIIYINSGNPVKLSEMFRVGLDIIMPLDLNEDQSLVSDIYRDILDREENKVRLEFPEKYFDKITFSDITIKEVYINHNTQIEFFGELNRIDKLPQKSQQIIILLKNIEGDLLDRIKLNINQMREGMNEYDESIMNLRTY